MLEGKAAQRAAFFWLFAAAAALVAYAVLNEPLRFALLHLQPLLIAAIFVSACAGLGWLCRAPDLLTSAALGIGIFGAFAFFAALFHLANAATFLVLMTVGLIACAFAIRTGRPATAGVRPFGLAIIFIVIALVLPFVAAPDVSTDALEYHLLIPKMVLEQNAIAYLPHFVESNYPSLGEYDFVALLAVGDERGAKAFHFLCAILVLFAVARLTPGENRTLAAALFFSMPVVVLTAGWAWNDMLFTLFVLLAIAHIIEERVILAGVLFGFATWTKYTFVLAAVGLVAMLIRRRSARDILRFALPAGAIAAVWMTKNAVLTGNPVYPFLNGVFHSTFWNDAADRYFHATLTHYEIPVWHWWTYVAFPFLLTLKPRVIDVHPGVLPLILLPLAFVRGRDRTTPALQTYIVAVVVAWLFIRTEMRSLLTVLAVLCALYASRIDLLRGWRWMVAAGVAANLVIVMMTTQIITSPARYFVGLETREQYVAREDAKQRAYQWLNGQANVGGVLLVGLHDPYYLNKRALFSSCCDTPIAQQIDVGQLKKQGITHIAFRASEFSRENREGPYSWTAQQREAFVAFLQQRCRPVRRIADVLILELT